MATLCHSTRASQQELALAFPKVMAKFTRRGGLGGLVEPNTRNKAQGG